MRLSTTKSVIAEPSVILQRVDWRCTQNFCPGLAEGGISGALGFRLQEQRVVNLLYLRLGFFDGSGVIDDEVRGLELGFIGRLCHHSARDFKASGLRIEDATL